MTAHLTAPPVDRDALERRVQELAHVVDRIAADPDVEAGLAPRVLAETLKFLEVAAAADEPVAPSRLVGVGWHHFILFTRDYMAHCAELGGYVHHVPDAPG